MVDQQPFVPARGDAGVVVDVPGDEDASAVGVMHQLSWQQTYPSAEHGIDAAWISEHIDFMASPGADDFRRALFAAQRADPTSTFYRVARTAGEVVGFVHASRRARLPAAGGPAEAAGGQLQAGGPLGQDATLEALYLLDEHHGSGLADQMMAAVLDWLGQQAMRLEVASYNARAIAFYRRHGFRPTGETAIFRERVPTATMRRSEHHQTIGDRTPSLARGRIRP